MRSRLSAVFLSALLVWMLYEGARLLRPFLGPIALAVAVGVVFFPLHARLSRLLRRWPRGLQAFASDFVVAAILIVPLGLMSWAVSLEAQESIPMAADWVHRLSHWLRSGPFSPAWARFLPRLDQYADEVLSALARAVPAAAANALSLLLDLAVFLLLLFFVFRDGPGMLAQGDRLVPLPEAERAALREKLRLTIIGVLRGTFLTALVQALTATAGYMIVRAQAAFILGLLTGIMTLVPGIGSPAVWLPVCLYYFLTGSLWKGAFLLGWGALIVGVVDNLLRPYIVGATADIPFLWLFLGLLGGIEVFGAPGILLGPLILGVIPVLLEMFHRSFLEEKKAP